MFVEGDLKTYRKFRESPIYFIKVMWGLVPQPLKPDYIEIAKSSPLKEYKAYWFEPFEFGRHISWQQWVILLAIEAALHGGALRRVSVASGHGIGKDAVASWLILWYLFCFKDSQVPCTAPTSEQMHDILWKEVAIWLGRMPDRYKDHYEWQNGHIRMVENPETWFARARTAKKENPEALAGVHGPFVFFIIDEASGVPVEVFRTAEGALTGENVLVLMLSNPTRLIGYFYESHHKDSENWQTFSFTSEESPIVDPAFVERIADQHGEDSDEYRIRVAGLFPKEDTVDEQGYVPLFSRAEIKTCADTKFLGILKMGMDAAGAGRDKSEWAMRDSFKAKIVLTETTSTPKTIGKKSMSLMTYYELPGEKMWIDNFGEGANASQEIALASGKRVNAVSFGDPPVEKRFPDKRFLNKRAEMYWAIKEWFKTGGEIVKDEKLIEQLLSIRYREEEISNKIKMMSKRDMKKAGLPSPDKADALALTFYEVDKVGGVDFVPDYTQKGGVKKYYPRLGA